MTRKDRIQATCQTDRSTTYITLEQEDFLFLYDIRIDGRDLDFWKRVSRYHRKNIDPFYLRSSFAFLLIDYSLSWNWKSS